MAPKENAVPIFGFQELDSTNSTAEEMLRTHNPALEAALYGSAKMAAIFAYRQKSGHGKGNRLWYSDGCLTFSLVRSFNAGELPARDRQKINDWITGPVLNFLESAGVEGVRIKAPNDIWVGNRKIAGILIRNILEEEHISRTIAGVGLNLNQMSFPEWLPNPVSLRQITGREYDVREVLEELCSRFLKKAL